LKNYNELKERSTISEPYGAIREVFGPEEEYGFFINVGLAIEIIEGVPSEFGHLSTLSQERH